MLRGRILVVDDELEVAAMLREILETLGYEVSVATSGDEAIAVVAAARPHVVLLDLVMPGMPGVDALAYFRQHHRRIPVIVVTGALDQESGQRARDEGAFEVLGKPFDLTTLQDMIAQAMRVALP